MPLPEKLCSEDELERKLHRARSARLVQRTQDAQRIRERAGSLAESRACAMDIHIAAPRVDRSKARMVEYIEGLCPELQRETRENGTAQRAAEDAAEGRGLALPSSQCVVYTHRYLAFEEAPCAQFCCCRSCW